MVVSRDDGADMEDRLRCFQVSTDKTLVGGHGVRSTVHSRSRGRVGSPPSYPPNPTPGESHESRDSG